MFLVFIDTGYWTGCSDPEEYLRTHGFPAERENSGSVIAIKTHYYGHGGKNVAKCPDYGRAVLAIRNPYHAMVAEYNRQATGEDHTGIAHPHMFKHPGKHDTAQSKQIKMIIQ